MSIIKINAAALAAAGFDRSFIEAMRHLVRQVGAETDAITLPQIAGNTELLTPVVAGLTLTITATTEEVDYLRANESDLSRSDAHLVRRLDDTDAALSGTGISMIEILRRLDDMQCDAERANHHIAEISRRVEELENRITQ